MPAICTAGTDSPSKEIEFFSPKTLLRHFSEYLLNDIVTYTPSTAAFDKKVADSILNYCLNPDRHIPLTGNDRFRRISTVANLEKARPHPK